MAKKSIYELEKEKLTKVFENVEEGKRQLAEGLIEQASNLRADIVKYEKIKNEIGYIKVHPQHKDIQRKTEVGILLPKLHSDYVNTIKALNSILSKNMIEEDDEFDEFDKEE